jgi:hypothetical protein
MTGDFRRARVASNDPVVDGVLEKLCQPGIERVDVGVSSALGLGADVQARTSDGVTVDSGTASNFPLLILR